MWMMRDPVATETLTISGILSSSGGSRRSVIMCFPFGCARRVLRSDPSDVSGFVGDQPSLSVVENYKRVVPGVGDNSAPADGDVEGFHDHAAARGNESLHRLGNILDRDIVLRPGSLC